MTTEREWREDWKPDLKCLIGSCFIKDHENQGDCKYVEMDDDEEWDAVVAFITKVESSASERARQSVLDELEKEILPQEEQRTLVDDSLTFAELVDEARKIGNNKYRASVLALIRSLQGK